MTHELNCVVRDAISREEWWTRNIATLECDAEANAEARQRMIAMAESEWAEQRATLISAVQSAESRIEGQSIVLSRAQDEVAAYVRDSTAQANSVIMECAKLRGHHEEAAARGRCLRQEVAVARNERDALHHESL